MEYFKCLWRHAHPDEPRWLYSELDDERREVRKVEVFPDGSRGHASADGEHRGTGLGEVPVPPLDEIAADPQFEPAAITREEFEAIWAQRER